MEAEKKRKRGDNGEKSNGEGGGRRKMEEREIMKGEKAESTTTTTPPPTEEEVEEFFAILRRMHAAVKYFEKSNGKGGEGGKLTGRWATALETEVLRGVEGVNKVGEKRIDNGGERNGVLDLNAIPEAESNSV